MRDLDALEAVVLPSQHLEAGVKLGLLGRRTAMEIRHAKAMPPLERPLLQQCEMAGVKHTLLCDEDRSTLRGNRHTQPPGNAAQLVHLFGQHPGRRVRNQKHVRIRRPGQRSTSDPQRLARGPQSRQH